MVHGTPLHVQAALWEVEVLPRAAWGLGLRVFTVGREKG